MRIADFTWALKIPSAKTDGNLFVKRAAVFYWLIGIVIAAVGTALAVAYDAPWIDGTASILIGCVLAAVAIVLARESKNLLIGERADPELQKAIREAAEREVCVRSVRRVLTTHMAPDQVIATMDVEFDDELTIPDVEMLIGRIEGGLRDRHPELSRVFIRPEPRRG